MLAFSSALAGQGPSFDDRRPRLPGRVGPGGGAVLADLDGDRDLDLARLTPAGVDVLLQQPWGAFERAPGAPLGLRLAAGSIPVSIGAGALRQGAPGPDLVVGVSGSDSLWLRNLGGGQFALAPASPFPRPVGFTGATAQVVIADLDARGGDDVLVLHDGAAPQLFVQQLTGGFAQAAGAFPAALIPQSPQVAADDFNGDGRLDLVLIQRATVLPPVLLLNNARGGFTPDARAFAGWPAGYAAGHVRAGAIDTDGVPDVVFAAAGGGRLVALRFVRTTGAFASGPSAQFAVPVLVDLRIGDFDGDGAGDLVILERGGAVLLARQRAGAWPATRAVLSAAPRRALLVDDLDRDGDADLYVHGASTEDRLLLGDNTGALLDTEENSVPLGTLPAPQCLAVVDGSGEGDPDLVGYRRDGIALAYLNDGAARFRVTGGMLPDLPGAVVRDVVRARVSGAAGGDLLLLSTPPGGGLLTGVRVLANTGAGFRDETALRWPAPTARSYEEIAVAEVQPRSGGQSGADDVVLLDSAGLLHRFVNTQGTYSELASAFAGMVPITGGVGVLLGDLNNDGWTDVIVPRQAGAPAVFLGNAFGSHRPVAQPIAGTFPARSAVLADLDGDRLLDLALLSPPALGLLFLLRGTGNGAFIDVSALGPAPLPLRPSCLALIAGRGATPDLAVGSDTAVDRVYHRSSGRWVAGPLPPRGAVGTARLIAADLDLDGDEDLLGLRDAHHPRLWFHQQMQLTQHGPTQLGRPLHLSLRAPTPGVGIFLLGVGGRLALPGYGILRLSPFGLVELARAPLGPTGEFAISVPTSPAFPATTIACQAVWADLLAGRARLGNLEQVRLVRY